MDNRFRLIVGAFGFLMLLAIAHVVIPPEDAPDQSGTEACLVVEQYVKDRLLKAPRTAKFGPCSKHDPGTVSHIGRIGNGKYIVSSYVDAENSFGAMIRTSYVARVQRVGTQWKMLDFVTDP